MDSNLDKLLCASVSEFGTLPTDPTLRSTVTLAFYKQFNIQNVKLHNVLNSLTNHSFIEHVLKIVNVKRLLLNCLGLCLIWIRVFHLSGLRTTVVLIKEQIWFFEIRHEINYC